MNAKRKIFVLAHASDDESIFFVFVDDLVFLVYFPCLRKYEGSK